MRMKRKRETSQRDHSLFFCFQPTGSHQVLLRVTNLIRSTRPRKFVDNEDQRLEKNDDNKQQQQQQQQQPCEDDLKTDLEREREREREKPDRRR